MFSMCAYKYKVINVCRTNTVLSLLTQPNPSFPSKGLDLPDYIIHVFFSCSVLRNPVIHKPQYRLYIMYRIPQLRVLDFRRIRQKVNEI